MIIIENYAQVTAQIENERGISSEELTDAIELALISACKRNYSENSEMEAHIDPQTGEADIWLIQTVVKTVEDNTIEITLKDAKKTNPKIKVGEILKTNITPKNFGRIAAQTAKQVIIQRIREAEKAAIFNEFSEKIGSIVIGTVQKIENRNYVINLGRIEAVLPASEQIPHERFLENEKIKVYISNVIKTPKGPVIQISRSHAKLIQCLLTTEVPEIQDNIIEIKSVSREAGKRAKVAVQTHNPSIGAVGTCVGHMGSRIQNIIKEIGNEKIDILEWDESPKKFIANSLKPAQISNVIILSEEEKTATVVVPDNQLSLAIGKMGINVRLAVKLTGWKLDIMSEAQCNNENPQERTGSSSLESRLKGESQKQNDATSEDTAAEAPITDENNNETKVSVVAKQLKLKTKDLIEEAQKIGIEIKSNRSLLSATVVDQLITTLSKKEPTQIESS